MFAYIHILIQLGVSDSVLQFSNFYIDVLACYYLFQFRCLVTS